MNKLLVPFNSSTSDTFIYHNASGRKFTCKDYPKLTRILSESLFVSNHNHHLMIDWTSCLTHPLIFNVNVQGGDERTKFDTLIQYFDSIFLGALQTHLWLEDVTFLLSMRKGGGMHVHVLNIEVAHDDYVHLCGLMKSWCNYREDVYHWVRLCGLMKPRYNYRGDAFHITLDCPSSMYLVASKKRNSPGGLYVPVRLIQFQNHVQRKAIDLLHHSELFRMMEMICAMSPVPSTSNVTYLEFKTRMVPENDKCLVRFTYCDKEYGLVKDRPLSINPSLRSNGGSFGYLFFKHKSNFLKNVHFFENRVLKKWYYRFMTR